jgi:hypothetical protein
LEHEREDVGVSPDIVGEESVASGHVCFVDKESAEEEEGDDEWGDEDGRVPSFDRGLGESEDKAGGQHACSIVVMARDDLQDKTSDEDGHTT